MPILKIFNRLRTLFSKPESRSSYDIHYPSLNGLGDMEDFHNPTPGPANAVFYVGCEGDEPLTMLISKNLQMLSDKFQATGYQFFFYPDFEKEKVKAFEKMLPALSYNAPQWHGREGDMIKIISSCDSTLFYESICKTYKLDKVVKPVFLSVLEDSFRRETNLFHVNPEHSIPDQLNKMMRDLVDLYNKDQEVSKFSEFSDYNPRDHSDDDENDEYDADNAFSLESSDISQDVRLHIRALLRTGQNTALLNIFNTLIQGSKHYQPELYKKFKEIGNKETDTHLSRLVVDKQYRIWLPDYNNMEIVMTPLPKTLYILFLLHPDGILFHDLADHKKELLKIYDQVTNSSNPGEIRKRINELTDMRNNSVNEKCSRIKEAFVSKMDESVARHYFIDGERKQVKKILLERDMVEIGLHK